MTLTATMLYALALAFVVMTALWLVQRKTHNAGIVDVGWSGLIATLALVTAGLQLAGADTLSGAEQIRILAASLAAALWGFRLSWHIHRRGHGKPEDQRYAELRAAWGERFQAKLFAFYHFQGVAAAIFALPFILILRNPATSLHVFELVGAAVWLIAWTGEVRADAQLAAFKADPANRGKVCDIGLWSRSRHPNYFFEWLIWCAVALGALPAPYGWIALACPVLMLYFLFKVTGIPATEEQALKSKGDAYRAYQASTPAFFPRLQRKASSCGTSLS